MNKAVEWFEKRIAAKKQICSLPTCDKEVKEAKERHISYMQDAISAIKFRETHEKHVLSLEEQVQKEVTSSLVQAGYEYDENMSIDNNIGSAMLSEYAKGYRVGEEDGRNDAFGEAVVLLHDKLFPEPQTTHEKNTNALLERCITSIGEKMNREPNILTSREQVSELEDVIASVKAQYEGFVEDLCRVLFEGEETDTGRKVTINRIKELVGYTRWLGLEFEEEVNRYEK